MNDDLNAPRAVAALFDFVREANRLLDGSKAAGPALRSAWEWAGQVLDVAGSTGRVEVTVDAQHWFLTRRRRRAANPSGRPGGRTAGWRRRRAATSSWLMRYATGSRPTASRSATQRTARRWSGSASGKTRSRLDFAPRAPVFPAPPGRTSPTGYPRVPPAVDLSLQRRLFYGSVVFGPSAICADVAQLAEHRFCKPAVVGSIPTVSLESGASSCECRVENVSRRSTADGRWGGRVANGSRL